jgi:hypothetical protein
MSILAGVAVLISEKIDFKLTLVKQGKKATLHTNKRGNTSKGNNNHQPICTEFQVQYTKKHKSIYRFQHSGSGRL